MPILLVSACLNFLTYISRVYYIVYHEEITVFEVNAEGAPEKSSDIEPCVESRVC